MSRKVEQLPESRAEKVLFFSKKLKKCCNLIKKELYFNAPCLRLKVVASSPVTATTILLASKPEILSNAEKFSAKINH